MFFAGRSRNRRKRSRSGSGREGSRDSKNDENGSGRDKRSAAKGKFRAEARAVLQRAEDQLDNAGRRGAKTIGEQDGDAALALILDTVAQDGSSSGEDRDQGSRRNRFGRCGGRWRAC